jgi:hypothetical protein
MTTDQVLAVLRIVFLKNGYWKLFSLIIAVLIYFSVRSEISHLRVVTVPVEADFDAAGMGAAIESVEPRSVRLTLRGSYSEVNRLDGSQMSCVVRPRLKPGAVRDTVEVKIRTSSLRGVRGVRVAAIEPNTALVKFDVPMSLNLAVAPPVVQGRARGRVQLVYAQTNAVVKGSRRILSPLDAGKVRVQTDVIDVEGRSQSFATRVRLFPPGDAVNAVVEPSDMVVNVQIISEKATARIERVPIVVAQPFGSPNRWTTEPAWVDIEVTGRSEEVKAVTFEQFIASVSGNVPATPFSVTNEVPVMVHVLQGVTVDWAEPVPSVVRLIPVPAEPASPLPTPLPNDGR